MGHEVLPPVLLIAWRRPEHVKRVLSALSEVRPPVLFLAVDGPDDAARPGEAARVAATIQTIESSITWECDVQRRYATHNQGCRRGVSAAIDWFFEHVDEGIILEDDIVPDADFFEYCRDLLSRYRDDPSVMCISGDNSADVWWGLRSSSYSFVRWPQIWGWATWRRAWELYDRDLSDYQRAVTDGRWEALKLSRLESDRYRSTLDTLLLEGIPDTWDYQWVATVLLNGGLSIHPRNNLVTNIGFDALATHTVSPNSTRADVASKKILPLSYPSSVRHHRIVSRRLFEKTQVSARLVRNSRLRRRLIDKSRYELKRVIARAFRAT